MKRFVCVVLLLALMAGCLPAFAQEIVGDQLLDEDAVKELQIDLIGAGYLDGEADGKMGSDTLAAIRAAQEALGLRVTGNMSDELSDALRENAFPMQIGSRSSMVLEVQETLYRWGFLEEEPSGYFGDSTADAVKTFQELARDQYAAYKLSKWEAEQAEQTVAADVVVDQPLFSAESIPVDGVMTREWYEFLNEDYKAPKIVANLDDQGPDVKLIQKRLHVLGYLYKGMDGVYGSGTALAMKYFQRKSGLEETGNCDEATSEALFGVDAPKSEEYVMPYAAYVNRRKSRVYILGWDGEGYNTPAKSFRCSCGKPSTPTLEGTYYCVGPISEWYYMKDSNTWVRYAFQIKGNYFFHSVLFDYKGDRTPTSSSLYALGSNVSHGCIRLAVDDVKWIYKHCTAGMKVIIV